MGASMDGYKEGRLLSFAGKDHFDLQIILSISCSVLPRRTLTSL